MIGFALSSMGGFEMDVMQMKAKYARQWWDKPESYWFARLIQECGELGSSLVGDHEDTVEHELKQIASICLNWLDMKALGDE